MTPSALGAGTVPAVLRAHAEADTGSEFLRLIEPGGEDRVLTYSELIEQAGRYAAFYAAAGLGPGERVIVVLRHSAELYAAYAGALLGGQVPAMFHFPSPKLSEDEYFRTVGTLLRGAGARVLVTYPELAEKLRHRESRALGETRVVTPEEVPPAPAPPPVEADPGEVAFLQYSSGTTGVKKGVAVSHRALLWQVESYASAVGATGGDRIVSWLPLYHDMGLVACLLLPLLQNVPLVAMSPFDWVRRPEMWARAVSDHAGTHSWLPNFAFAFMAHNVRDESLAGVDLSSLRGVVNCSEPIMQASQEAFVDRFAPQGMTADRLGASYAMAENTFAVTSAFGSEPVLSERDGRVNVSSGRPLPETDVNVSDGELVIRSPALFSGYDGNLEATAAALRNGWLHTGDLGYVEDGEVFVTGRARDLIIVGGRNLYPQDIEAAVERVPGVVGGRVVAFGVPDERAGTEDLVVMAESEDPGVQHAVRDAVAQLTETVPHDVRIVAPRTLVKSSSGKLARGENRLRYMGAAAAAREPAADSGLLGRVRTLARGAEVDENTPLITSGLIDSLTMVDLLTYIEDSQGVRIPNEALADPEALDTVARITATVERLRSAGEDPVEQAPDLTEIAMQAAVPGRPSNVRGALLRLWLRARGAKVGAGLRVLGPVFLQLEGSARNLEIGSGVTLMPGAHLKNRENGRLVLHDGSKIDSGARAVAANDALFELGARSTLGIGTVVNAGVDVRIGRMSMTAAHCVINASEHGMGAGTPMQEQGYRHAEIAIGEDVWIGAGAFLSQGTRIGSGAVVSAHSVVAGDVPSGAIVGGRPARVIKFRS